MRRARLGRLAAVTTIVLLSVGGGGAVALAESPGTPPPGPGVHQCGHGLHPKTQPAGLGADLHQCGHGLHPGQQRNHPA
jgi:hypothetical protein